MIYFDNSATTKISPDALATYNKVSTDFFGNPSSLHALGTKANEVLQSSRAQIAKLIGAKPDEIYFTSGGTEGDNWVIKGTAMAKREFGLYPRFAVISISNSGANFSSCSIEKPFYEEPRMPKDLITRTDYVTAKNVLDAKGADALSEHELLADFDGRL